MKKKIVKLLVVGGLIFFSAMPALAATVLVSPATINVVANQNFNLSLSVDPQGGKDYTAKIELKFPADLLEVNSFTMASGWMPLTMAGYDAIDNTNGSLTKTGGYPGGLSSSASFGTVSFKAKKSGSGVISLGGASLILDATNKNILTGSPSASVVIATAPVGTPKPSLAPQTTTTISPSASPVVSGSPAPTPVETIASESPTASPLAAPAGETFSLLAGIFNLASLGTGNAIVIIVVLLLIGAIAYIGMTKFKRKQQ
ncbi:MAG: hypothetical protein Q8O87_04010 [bacterium]|nr:hypothetical protein [bacterium]